VFRVWYNAATFTANAMKSPLVRIIPTAGVIALVIGFLHFTTVFASPSAPIEVTLTQPDGTSFTARQWGDEWTNGFETGDGYSILQMDDGWWVYARLQADGSLGPSLSAAPARRVGVDQPGELPLHLRATGELKPPLIQKKILPSPAAEPEYILPPASGEIKVLVLLAKFTDRAESYPAGIFEQLTFGLSGSLKSYYAEVSYGSLNLIPAQESCGTADDGITEWRELPYAHPNTGSSTGEANLQLTKDILTLNDDCVDYASFDQDLDGSLAADELQIVVVVAGWERAYSDFNAPSIWAHSFYLDFLELPLLDGVTIGSYYEQSYYAQIGEIHGTAENQHPATLGVLAHEFGHLLNWPDLYDVDGSTNGVGRWSVMGSGSWNKAGTWDGDTPAHPDAWSKWYQGWLTPVEISGNQTDLVVNQAEDSPQAYLVRPNPKNIDWIFNYHTGRGQYFLVENRELSGYDAGLPGCGILIWHVNEYTTFSNQANARDAAPLVSLEQADGLDQLGNSENRGDEGDPFPGSTGNLQFDLSTTPNSNRLDGGISGVSMHVDSAACAATMQVNLSYQLETTIHAIIQKADGTCSAWETMLSEDFEDGLMDGWTATDENGEPYGDYSPAVRNCRADNSIYSAWLVGGGVDGSALACGDHYSDHIIPWMTYGPFSTLGENAIRLDFSHWTYIEPSIPFNIFDRFCVWASDNNEQFMGYCFTGDWGGWFDYSFSLKDNVNGFYDYLNKPQVWIAFSMMTDDYIHFPEGAYVDNIRMRKCTNPLSPSSHTESSLMPSPQIDRFSLFDLINPFVFLGLRAGPQIIGPLFVTR
jgi:M6 family metalloprotease-like protein